MVKFEELLEQYNYELSQQLIALTPAIPRDHAKLFIYNRSTKTIHHDRFINLAKHLPKNSVLVFNKTRVIPAKIPVTKSTGGKLSITYIETVQDSIRIMATKQLFIGNTLFITKDIYFTVVGDEAKYYLLKPSFPMKQLYEVLTKYGKTQLPPYLENSKLSETDLKKKYQSVFAKENGSIAAPTASLHFTNRLINKLQKSGIATEYITLHVNLGTFGYLTEDHIQTNKLHLEYYEIDNKTAKRLNTYKKNKRTIVAVGTTVVRALESAAQKKQISKLSGTTDLFIQEQFSLQFVDSIITNFHVPKSSLLMLVSAFVGRKTLLDLYQRAIQDQYRFYSFGDGMLVI